MLSYEELVDDLAKRFVQNRHVYRKAEGEAALDADHLIEAGLALRYAGESTLYLTYAGIRALEGWLERSTSLPS